MNQFFEVKAKYVKVDETSGKEKRVSEPYLVDAMTWTEAEARINKELEQMISGDFILTKINPSSISDVVRADDGENIFHKVKVQFIDTNETTGKEKRSNYYYLVESNTIEQANSNTEEFLKDLLVPFEIKDVVSSPIVDVFIYFKQKEEVPENFKPVGEVNA